MGAAPSTSKSTSCAQTFPESSWQPFGAAGGREGPQSSQSFVPQGLCSSKQCLGAVPCCVAHGWAASSPSPSQPCTRRTLSLFSTILIINNNNIPRLSGTAGKGSLRHPLKETSTQLAAGNSSEHQRAWSGGGRQIHV